MSTSTTRRALWGPLDQVVPESEQSELDLIGEDVVAREREIPLSNGQRGWYVIGASTHHAFEGPMAQGAANERCAAIMRARAKS